MKNAPQCARIPSGTNISILEKIQSAKSIEKELLSEHVENMCNPQHTDESVENQFQPEIKETFGLIQMFAQCSLSKASPRSEENQIQNGNAFSVKGEKVFEEKGK